MASAPENRWFWNWLTPGGLFPILGAVAMVVGAWMSFEGRISTNERDIRALTNLRAEDARRFDRMDDKLDRLIERPSR